MLTQIIEGDIMLSKLDDIVMRTGETNRIIIFRLWDGKGESITSDDYSMEFVLQKPDGNFVIQNLGSITDGFYLHTTEQMSVVCGRGYYTLRISDADDIIYTAHGGVIIDDNTLNDSYIESISEVNGLRFPDDFLTINDNVAVIDDDTISEDKTWSSEKISNISFDVSKTVTGNPVEFSDGANSPISSGILTIQGYQEGSGIPTAENVRPIHYYSSNVIRVEDIDESGINYITSYPINIYSGYVNLYRKGYTCNKLVIILNTSDMNNTDSAPGWNNCGISDIVGEGHYIIQNIAICNICNKYNIDTMLGNDRITLENTGKTQTQLIAMALDVQIVVELSAPQFGDITISPYPIKTLKGYNKISVDYGSLKIIYITEEYSPITTIIPGPTEIQYTETERKIGKWIDGSDLYEIVFKINNLSSGFQSITHNLPFGSMYWIECGFAEYIISGNRYTSTVMPYSSSVGVEEFRCALNKTNINYRAGSDILNNSGSVKLVIRYTK